MKKINVKHIQNLNSDNLRGFDFYKQELGFIQKRLDEIVHNNTAKEVLEKADHFQNQLLIHRNAIDELQSLVKANNRTIELELIENEPFVDKSLACEHEKLNNDYQTEEKLVNDLRHEFNRFAAEWM